MGMEFMTSPNEEKNPFDEPTTQEDFVEEAMKVVHAQAFEAGADYEMAEAAIKSFLLGLSLVGGKIVGASHDGVPFCGDCGSRM